jgi:hypothetical protein
MFPTFLLTTPESARLASMFEMRKILCCFVLGFLFYSGCSTKHDVDGVDVWGTAIWGDDPIPTGMVTFTPDASQGNTGHQGWAEIKDGEFDTRKANGKLAPKGPCVILISSKQPSQDPSHPRVTGVILRHQQTLDISSESGQLDLTVPESQKASVVFPDGEE